MDIQTIIDAIKKIGEEETQFSIQQIIYVADKSDNTCHTCLENDQKIFNIDAFDLPQLPIHPHCHCKYVSLAAPQIDVSEDVEKYILLPFKSVLN